MRPGKTSKLLAPPMRWLTLTALLIGCGSEAEEQTPLAADGEVAPDAEALRPSDAQAMMPVDAGAPAVDGEAPSPLEEVAALLSGRFDSVDHAREDPQYFEISLRVCAAEAPSMGSHVLYVEQAVMGSLDEPYRQRLYVLEQEGERVRSVVWAFEHPERLVGWCDALLRPEVEEALPVLRPGCAVTLERQAPQHWAGGTEGARCLSSLRGATYASAEVELWADRLESWDRGYGGDGAQVWGATAGPYRFLRREAP